MPSLLPLAALLLSLAGCTQFPEIDARVPPSERGGAAPNLIPLQPLLARADAATADSRVSATSGTDLEARAAALAARPVPAAATGSTDTARAAALEARAAALRGGPVITDDARARLDAGVTLPAALQ